MLDLVIKLLNNNRLITLLLLTITKSFSTMVSPLRWVNISTPWFKIERAMDNRVRWKLPQALSKNDVRMCWTKFTLTKKHSLFLLPESHQTRLKLNSRRRHSTLRKNVQAQSSRRIRSRTTAPWRFSMCQTQITILKYVCKKSRTSDPQATPENAQNQRTTTNKGQTPQSSRLPQKVWSTSNSLISMCPSKLIT